MFALSTILFVTLLIAPCFHSKPPCISSTLKPKCADTTNKSSERKGLFKSDERVFVRNQALVKFKTGISPEAVEKIAQELDLKIIKRVFPPHLYLMEASDSATVEEIMKRLRGCEQVEYCEPNYIYKIPKQ
jgi:hypothetical protein